MTTELLIIMAKYPTRGRVKTRLARDIGAKAATELYRSFLAHFAREFVDAPFAVEWRYTPARAPFRRIVGKQFTIRPQPEGNLGERMEAIFDESFTQGFRRVVMIGTDAPEVGVKIVLRAFRLLKVHRAVFQPTLDGGYALVGLSAMTDIFSRVNWSTPRVMAQTRQRMRRAGADFAELSPTYDVDISDDLVLLQPSWPL
jgi:rSAM/selenodomain-associated transferase 1